MKKQRERYIPNEYDYKSISIEDIKKQIKEQLALGMTILNKEYPHNAKKEIWSHGKEYENNTLYTGTGGNIYFYWRLYLLNKTGENLTKVQEAYETNLALVKKSKNTSPSFFMSSAGIYSLGCILAKELNDKAMYQRNLDVLLQYSQFCTEDSEDELLYGTAGYLYCLLLVDIECNKTFNHSLEKEIVNIALILISNGVNQMNHFGLDCLTYPFPKTSYNKYSLYLGAAHGSIGVLYQILCAVHLYPNSFTEEHKAVLLQSLHSVQKLQFDSGNFPSCLNEQDKDNKVHWCHGAIGAIHLFNLGYIIFNDKGLLTTAIKCGGSLWERGILLKGNGVCHGISGIVYGLYKLYAITKEEEYKRKAYAMIQATYDPKISEKVTQCEDPQRKVIGKPDTLYSLMEGMQGSLTRYCDLLNDKVVFPGYEIV